MRSINGVDGIRNGDPAPVVKGENVKVSRGTSRFRRPVTKKAGVRDVTAEDGPDGLFGLTTDFGESCDQTAVGRERKIPGVDAKSGIFIQLSWVKLEIIGTSDLGKSGLGRGNGRTRSYEGNRGKSGDSSSPCDTFKDGDLILRAGLPET